MSSKQLVTRVFRDWTDDFVRDLKYWCSSTHWFQQTSVDAILAAYPEYSTKGAGAFDLRVFIAEPMQIKPGQRYKLPSGLRMQLPADHSLVILPRSGKGSEGMVLANLVGLVDLDYRGMVWLTLWNTSDQDITINPLDRVMQAMVVHTPQTAFEFVASADELEPTKRGEGGFGSTGST